MISFLTLCYQFCAKFRVNSTRVVPVNEFLAKNIGIRRAKGTFVVPMAMDTILSDAFWKFFSAGGENDDVARFCFCHRVGTPLN